MNLIFVDERDDPSLSISAAELEDLVARTLQAERFPSSIELAVTLVDEPAMAQLNSSHLGKSGPTDVLSFPLEQLQPGQAPAAAPAGPPLHIGDVFICPDVVATNADTSGVPFGDEMALMVVHGLLHLLGYDHVVDSEAEQMEQRERDLMATVGRVRP